MSSRSEHERALAERLYQQGLPLRAARRMAREWCDHEADLRDEACAAGVDTDAARAQARSRLGSAELMIATVAAHPACVALVADRGRADVALRWGGASLAGLAATLVLFAALTRVLGL